jgi:RNase H-fold protein (predicted Holliday junction resolvase)
VQLEVSQDREIATLVLGRPAGNESFFSKDELSSFAEKIEAETQTQVIFAETENKTKK